MKNNEHTPSEQELRSIGITPQDIEEAGGIEAITHIAWFLQQDESHIDVLVNETSDNKEQEDALQPTVSKETENSNNRITAYHHQPIILMQYDDDQKDLTVKQIYEKNWGDNPSYILKLFIKGYFLDIEDTLPNDDADIEEVLKTINLFQNYIIGKPLPLDAEEEQLIVYGYSMYQEFLGTSQEYHNCPMAFLLDECYDILPEKYRMIAKNLPDSAVVRIFADNCFYDNDSVEEPLPEEIDIKNLCDMIEKLAIIFKIWQ